MSLRYTEQICAYRRGTASKTVHGWSVLLDGQADYLVKDTRENAVVR
jgi:hypothetical protein